MHFAREALKRIVVSSLFISVLAGYVAWTIAVESAEKETVNLAIEASYGAVAHFQLPVSNEAEFKQKGLQTTNSLILDWFDIAELYDRSGKKIAESLTQTGHAIESALPHHVTPTDNTASYESLHLKSGEWILRTFVPLETNNQRWGYLEGVRVVPDWQRNDIRNFSLWVSVIAASSAWLCAIIIYPLILFLNKQNIRYTAAMKTANVDMMFTMGKAITLRDCDTGAHNYRVAWLASELAEESGHDPKAMKALILGSYLHDVGKIAISDSILLKPGKLSESEMEIMKSHVNEGVRMIEGIPWLEDAKPIIESHHEKWDGSGYPNRLSGETIPLNARIFAIADVFDALCAKRPYKEPFSFEKALSIIVEGKGLHFDPTLVEHFHRIAKRLYETICMADEETCRSLMSAKIEQYFFIDNHRDVLR